MFKSPKECDILKLFKTCKTCLHFIEFENICIKYSPHYIVDTCENDSCDKWEER